ncbi:MAG: 50S ribosomal protein L18 [Candidatus Babeliales bacterium]
MSLVRKLKKRKERRALRVRKAFDASDLPRITVFRSAKHMYGQLINDASGETVASYSTLSLEKKIKGDKKAVAHHIGVELAKKALGEGIKQVVFDRGAFLYHGRVKAFADGLREGGLKI